MDQRLLAQLRERFQRRGLVITPNNEKQACIPQGSIPVDNPNGTAPALIVEGHRGVIISLLGVPFEMKWLFQHEVVPYLQRNFGLSETITYRVLKVVDLGESSVDDRIGHLIAGSSNPTVGVLAHPGQVDVRIAAKSGGRDDALALISPVEDEVRRLLGRHVFAADEQSMEDVVGELLRQSGLTIAVYEDITGGMTAERLQEASPDQFIEAVIGNGPASFRRLLTASGNPEDGMTRLFQDDAGLTDALARAVRVCSAADLGVAVHVVPGVGQQSENLGQGMTYISVASQDGMRNRVYHYGGRGRLDRIRISLNALDLLRVNLLGNL